MICILSATELEAQRWAAGQLLDDDEWFFPKNEIDLLSRSDFHVIVVGSIHSPSLYFERVLSLAKQRGRMK